MQANKTELFNKRLARVKRINNGQDASLEPRKARRVLRILAATHRYLWERDKAADRGDGLRHPGKDYLRAIRRYS